MINITNIELIDKLNFHKQLSPDEWIQLFSDYSSQDRKYAAELASALTKKIFGSRIYFRGIIEFTNICKNDCRYCGIRKSNTKAVRYRLTKDEILSCCEEGYSLGYRTFVLQGGEDGYFRDDLLENIIKEIKTCYPDCAITLSLGERSRASYEKLYRAGADRYLLRHETADSSHYSYLHPEDLSFENRMQCLKDLKETGFQTGCGMMIGSPGQTASMLAEDMKFLKEFNPEMIGIGPFIPHSETPFANEPGGSVSLTLFTLSLIRLMLPKVLLPATTALGSLEKDGRISGILAGCNVIMPNLSPAAVRKKYLLYDNKADTDINAEDSIRLIRERVGKLGYTLSSERGDYMSDSE